MRPGRVQFNLGSLMIAIAILAVGFSFPQTSALLALGAIASYSVVVVPAFLYHVITRWRLTGRREP